MFNGQASRDVQGARCLGWTSIAIGLAEVLATKQVENLMGLKDTSERRGVLRVLGVRELGHGISILTEDRPSKELVAGIWSRVVGDVLDSALLGVAATKTRKPFSFAAVTASVMLIGVLDMLYALKITKHHHEQSNRYATRTLSGLRRAGELVGIGR